MLRSSFTIKGQKPTAFTAWLDVVSSAASLAFVQKFGRANSDASLETQSLEIHRTRMCTRTARELASESWSFIAPYHYLRLNPRCHSTPAPSLSVAMLDADQVKRINLIEVRRKPSES